MPELATAWVTLTISARNARRDIQRELDGVDGGAAGRRAGQRFSAGVAGATNLTAVERQMVAAGQRAGQAAGKALGVGLKAGAAAGVAAVGTSIKLGADRLLAIDDARGKLKGLGHDAAAQAKIMDSALTAVKGTAFGLGDAATISASAVAAGIKPGAELTKYLKSTADAATIAGSSLSEMGSIFNKVQTGQSAMTDDLNMLADRGVPIYQWVAKEMKISAGEVKKYAEKGKIDSATFFKAINDNIGGAALESGKTVRGSFNNMKAAVGRFGAALDEPSFKRAPATFTAITRAIDDATPAAGRFAQSLDAKVFEQWVPAAQRAWRELSANPEVRSSMAEVGQIVSSIGITAQQVWPAIQQIGASLGQASAALGVSGWRLFLTTLEAAAGVVNALAGPLQTVADLMRDHPGLVTAALAGWLAFRTVPSILGNLRTGVASVTTEGAKASGAVQNLGAAFGRLQGGADRIRGIGSAFAAYGGSFRDAVAEVQKINPSLSRAQASVATFGAFAGNAAQSGFGALRKGASGVVDALGGPWGAAFAAAGIAATAIISQNQKSAQSMDAVRRAAKEAASAQNELNDALIANRGSATAADVKSAGKARVDALRQELEATASREGSWWDRSRNEAGNTTLASMFASAYGGGTGKGDTKADAIDRQANQAREATAALDALKLTQQSLSDVTYGSSAAFQAMVSKLDAAGDGGKQAADKLREARKQFQDAQAVAQKLTPGISDLSKAMQILGDKTASAADKSSALKTALDALNPARTAADADGSHTKTLQQIAEKAKEAADATGGLGDALFRANGSINATLPNGAALNDTLKQMVDSTADVASKGGDMPAALAANNRAIADLARQYGTTEEKIRAAANTLGLQDAIWATAAAKGNDVTRSIGAVATAFSKVDGKTASVTVKTTDIESARKQIEQLGFSVQSLPDGTTTITAQTDAAKLRLAEIQSIVTAGIPPNKPVNVSAPGGDAVFQLLKSLGAEVTINNNKDIQVQSPLAPAVLELLRSLGIEVRQNNDKTITVKSVGGTETLTMLNGLKATIEQIPNEKRVRVTYTGAVTPNANPNPSQIPLAPGVIPNANGSITSYANGGIDGRLPSQAVMQRGRGRGLVQWAEGETGIESFIPWATGKRRRSTMILSETARAFGYQLVRPGDFFQSFANGGLRPGAATLKDVISSKFGISDIGGYRPEDGYGEHSSGRALDVMVGSDKSKGDAVTSFVMANASRLGLKWAIWQQAMHYPDGRVVPMADRGSPTQNHMDHVHIFLDESSDKADLSSLGGSSSAAAAFEGIGDDSGGSGSGSSETQPTGSYGGGGFGRLGTAIAEALFGPRSGGSGGSGGSGSGGGSGSSSSASASKTAAAQAANAKKVREAQDKADDAEKKIAVEEQKLKELEAKPKTKASALQAQRDRVEKAKRDAAQAKTDLETARTSASTSTGSSSAAGTSKQLVAAQNKAEDAEKAAALAKQQLAEVEANPKATKSAKEAAKNRAEKTQRDAEQAKTDLEALKSKGTGSGKSGDGKTGDNSSDTSEFQSLGQNLVSGMLQAVGLDGSLFSNPFEWPNVKSAFALLNWGGGLAKSLSGSDSENAGGLVGGAGAGLGLNIPNLADLAKPQTPQAPVGPGGALPLRGGGVTYDFRGANLGVNPKEMTQRIDSRQNAAFRRQSGALV
ncbi:tape measure protein [Tsukamurella conjunctivitidis]|uniref:Tape measure protein n=1 Tax=Tsukamurella conjunctivitidis TaxID=2592068 RepID=A0A5C5RWY6_9ACTN|nr:tape measure protein [Tsukamurella conjunctivitidis]TWS27264.1 tape measure protein [Tsukamurella conjunctivitidis]